VARNRSPKKVSSKKSPKQSPVARSSGKPLGVSLDELESVLELMSKHSLAELEWESAGSRIHLKTPAAMLATAPTYSVAMPTHAPVASSGQSSAQAPSQATAPSANSKQVKSPFVGTFYRSSSPGGAPYVSAGQKVKAGDALCIVEAMKLMNEIESEWNGTIVQVLAENGQAVEFGEPLFVIET
jgi:acetyl-CoA carboxylase biotin carboxyl carrier protein